MPKKEKSQTPGGNRGPISESNASRHKRVDHSPAGGFAGSKRDSQAKPSPGRKLPDGPFATISRRAADRLRSGHVWVYQSDVEKVIAPIDDSGLISVMDSRGMSLGTALYSAHSQIALRMVSTAAIDDSTWLNQLRQRLRAAIALRETVLATEGTNACRLVFSEADFLPGMIADKYGDVVILQLLTRGMDTAAVRSAFVEVIAEQIGPRAIFERNDLRIREIEQLSTPTDGPVYVKTGNDGIEASQSRSTIFHLNGLQLKYDANSGQKTGAFLDQRENYAAAARFCRGEALDVCTYQGGFALHLARVCEKVTGVDSSRAALEVAESNLALNRERLGSTEVDWVEANAFDLLRDWSDSGRKFDSIVLDPPAFAKSKRAAEGALRGYKELNLRALKMLRPGGILITCSCSHHVGMEDFTGIVATAASDARRPVRLLERRGAAPDHPVLLGVPETEYLKCLICRVD